MHLLTAVGASVEESIAGLLHDVPHTAFSHTVDIVFPSENHNFHERFQQEVILNSSIPAILKAHDVPLRAALEPYRYPLLEQPLPDLCADRVDYTLRDMQAAGRIEGVQARDFLTRLAPSSEGLVVSDTAAALWFGVLFIEANATLWTGADEAGSYWALAGAIKRALALGLFGQRDLFTTDDVAMARLRGLHDPIVDAYLRLLEPGTHFYEVSGRGPAFATQMKDRAVDPLVSEPGWMRPRRLSSLSPEYAALLPAGQASRIKRYRLWSDSIDPLLTEVIRPRRA